MFQFIEHSAEGRMKIKYVLLFLKDSKEKIVVYPSNSSGLIPLPLYPNLFMAFQEAVKKTKHEKLELKFAEFQGTKITYEAFLFEAIKKEAVQRMKKSELWTGGS